MDFSKPISKFQTLGVYDYKLDEVGNVMVNSSSGEFAYNYLRLPLWNSNYDKQAIESYYDVNFTEFVPEEEVEVVDGAVVENSQIALEEMASANEQLASENEALTEKINELISLSEGDSSIAENEAVKQVILELRIALKQGKEEKEFSTEFPYLPIPIE